MATTCTQSCCVGFCWEKTSPQAWCLFCSLFWRREVRWWSSWTRYWPVCLRSEDLLPSPADLPAPVPFTFPALKPLGQEGWEVRPGPLLPQVVTEVGEEPLVPPLAAVEADLVTEHHLDNLQPLSSLYRLRTYLDWTLDVGKCLV